MQNILKRFSTNQPEIANPIRERILKYLTENDWNVQQGEYSLSIRVRCDNAIYPIYIFIFEESRIIQIYSYLEAGIPENKKTVISEYFTRINYGMPIGNFELNLDDGGVRYKTSISIGDNIEFLTEGIIEALIVDNYCNMDRYYPGFMRILYSNDTDIKKIIQEIEDPVKE